MYRINISNDDGYNISIMLPGSVSLSENPSSTWI